MSVLVRIPARLVEAAKKQKKRQHRSIGSQIEHWSVIGRIAEQNPGFKLEDILKKIEMSGDE